MFSEYATSMALFSSKVASESATSPSLVSRTTSPSTIFLPVSLKESPVSVISDTSPMLYSLAFNLACVFASAFAFSISDFGVVYLPTL